MARIMSVYMWWESIEDDERQTLNMGGGEARVLPIGVTEWGPEYSEIGTVVSWVV
jgi:hypothetical protein